MLGVYILGLSKNPETEVDVLIQVLQIIGQPPFLQPCIGRWSFSATEGETATGAARTDLRSSFEAPRRETSRAADSSCLFAMIERRLVAHVT
jgi:hypothetical protein